MWYGQPDLPREYTVPKHMIKYVFFGLFLASAVCGDLGLLRHDHGTRRRGRDHLFLPRQLRTPEGDLRGAVCELGSATATRYRLALTQYTQ